MFGLSWLEFGVVIGIVVLLYLSNYGQKRIRMIVRYITVVLLIFSYLSFTNDTRQSALDEMKAAKDSLMASGLTSEQVSAVSKLAEAQSEIIEANAMQNVGLILIFGFLFLGPTLRDNLRDEEKI